MHGVVGCCHTRGATFTNSRSCFINAGDGRNSKSSATCTEKCNSTAICIRHAPANQVGARVHVSEMAWQPYLEPLLVDDTLQSPHQVRRNQGLVRFHFDEV